MRFDRLPARAAIQGKLVTRSASSSLCAVLSFTKDMESPVAPIYLYHGTMQDSEQCEPANIQTLLASLDPQDDKVQE